MIVNCLFEVGLSSFIKICFLCFNESPLQMMKNAFYSILKTYFGHKIFKLFRDVEKIGLIRETSLTSKFMTSQPG